MNTLFNRRKPDLECSCSYPMHFRTDRNNEKITINIVSRKGMSQIKKKHYWIYSDKGFGCGKSLNLKKFSDYFNADFFTLVKKPKNVQFLMLDDYDREDMVSPLDLMMVTGRLPGMYLGKTALRRDVQIIVASRYSPYEIFAKNKQKGCKRLLDPTALAAIEDRFFVYKVDDQFNNVNGDKARFLHPRHWSEETLLEQLRKLFVEIGGKNYSCFHPDTESTVVAVMQKIMEAKRLIHHKYDENDDSSQEICVLKRFMRELGDSPVPNVSYVDLCDELFDVYGLRKRFGRMTKAIDSIVLKSQERNSEN